MTGCLTAPFRLIGCLGLLALLALGWLYRDRVERGVRGLLHGGPAVTAAEASGRPGLRALRAARAKMDSLTARRADSVVLSPAEVASLMGNGLDRTLRSQLDSLQVRLLEGEIALRARLRTARLPREAVGPLTIALRETEPIEAAGPLRVVEPGQGEWRVRSFRIRDFPLPADLIPGLLARTLDRPKQEALPVAIPPAVAEIRIQPSGATLYGVPRE